MSNLRSTLQRILKAPPPTVVVVGDVMLDRYLTGEAERLSPEAPVPVVHLSGEWDTLGGAANVAANVRGMEATAVPIGVIGDDENGARVIALLEEAGISPASLLTTSRPTTTKTRVVAGTQQLVRIDREDASLLEEGRERWLIRQVADVLRTADMCIVSDYGKGVCSASVLSSLLSTAAAHNVPVIIDPKGPDYTRYVGATCVVPNRHEASQVLGRSLTGDEGFADGARQLREQFGFRQVLITRSAEGMTLLTDAGVIHIPSEAREVFEVSGASDTVVAVMAVALATGVDYESSAMLANKSASLVIARAGTVPIHLDDLQANIPATHLKEQNAQVLGWEEVEALAEKWRARGSRIIFTNGCFDLLHKGHMLLLQQAAEFGDVLIVGLNDDDSVRRLKGPGRPIQHQEDRATLLAGIRCVDAVVVFNQDTPIELIQRVRPHVLVKGADYGKEDVVGTEFVESYGGEVVLVPLVPGRSTSAIIGLMRAAENPATL